MPYFPIRHRSIGKRRKHDEHEDTGVIGDWNGLFFDLADDSIADNLEVSGTDLTGENIKANSVSKVDGYNNLNGEVVKEDGKYDVGVQFGSQGIGEDDIQSTSFTLSTADGSALSLTDILKLFLINLNRLTR